jgi:hypothetical protein
MSVAYLHGKVCGEIPHQPVAEQWVSIAEEHELVARDYDELCVVLGAPSRSGSQPSIHKSHFAKRLSPAQGCDCNGPVV